MTRRHAWSGLRTRRMDPVAPKKDERKRCPRCGTVIAWDRQEAIFCEPCGGPLPVAPAPKKGSRDGDSSNKRLLEEALGHEQLQVPIHKVIRYKDPGSCASSLRSSIAYYGFPLTCTAEDGAVWIRKRKEEE